MQEIVTFLNGCFEIIIYIFEIIYKFGLQNGPGGYITVSVLWTIIIVTALSLIIAYSDEKAFSFRLLSPDIPMFIVMGLIWPISIIQALALTFYFMFLNDDSRPIFSRRVSIAERV